jgi:hypothetical protein
MHLVTATAKQTVKPKAKQKPTAIVKDWQKAIPTDFPRD